MYDRLQALCGNYYQDRLDWIPDGTPPYYVSPVFHFGRDNLGVEAASASAEHFAGTPPVTDLQVCFPMTSPWALTRHQHCSPRCIPPEADPAARSTARQAYRMCPCHMCKLPVQHASPLLRTVWLY